MRNINEQEVATTPTTETKANIMTVDEGTAEAFAANGSKLQKSSSDHTVASAMDNAGEESSL